MKRRRNNTPEEQKKAEKVTLEAMLKALAKNVRRKPKK